jgi:hypothetical protein
LAAETALQVLFLKPMNGTTSTSFFLKTIAAVRRGGGGGGSGADWHTSELYSSLESSLRAPQSQPDVPGFQFQALVMIP